MTEERRKEVVRHLNKELEDVNHDAQYTPRRESGPSESGQGQSHLRRRREARAQGIQKLTDDEIKRMDEMSKAKEKEIMHI